MPKSSAKITESLMYRHWDEWVETIPHPFVADFDGQKISNVTDMLKGEPYECPMKPFGGVEQLAWSPDSKTIAYTCRKRLALTMLQVLTATFISMMLTPIPRRRICASLL